MDGCPGPGDGRGRYNSSSNQTQARGQLPQRTNRSSNIDSDHDLDSEILDMHKDLEFSDCSDDEESDEIFGPGADLQRTLTPPGQINTDNAIQIPATPDQRRSKRVRTNKYFGANQEDCAESDCEDPLSQEEKVMCTGPGCNAMVCHSESLTVFIYKLRGNRKYHLSCVGLDVVPTGGWFCDMDCRKNAGQRVAPVRKRRRIVVSD